MVKTDEPFIKYVGDTKFVPHSILDSMFEIIPDLYVANVKPVRTIDLVQESKLPNFDVFKAIQYSKQFKMTYIPQIEFDITETAPYIFELKLQYFDDPLDEYRGSRKMKKVLTAILTSATDYKLKQ